MVQRGGLAGEAERSAEQPRLLISLPGQLRTAYSPREAEVVADQGTRTSLPAEGLPFNDHRAEALGSAIDRRSQAGGSCPAVHQGKVADITKGGQCKGRDSFESVS